MSTTWTLTRERLCDKALEKCGAIGVGETPSAADRSLCLEALDGILKQLSWYGYAWPKYTQTSSAVTFTANVQTVSVPADFYGSEMLYYTDSGGNDKQLARLSLDQWSNLPNKTATGTYPVKYFLDNADVIHVWPIQTANVSGKLVYQKIIDDSAAGSSVNLDSPWLLGLVYGIAEEVGNEFGVSPQRIQWFAAKWQEARRAGIQNTAFPKVYAVSVDQ